MARKSGSVFEGVLIPQCTLWEDGFLISYSIFQSTFMAFSRWLFQGDGPEF